MLPLADGNVVFRISATTLVHLVGSPLPMSGSTNNKSTTDGWMDEVTSPGLRKEVHHKMETMLIFKKMKLDLLSPKD